jgi:hypothetical protein
MKQKIQKIPPFSESKRRTSTVTDRVNNVSHSHQFHRTRTYSLYNMITDSSSTHNLSKALIAPLEKMEAGRSAKEASSFIPLEHKKGYNR